MLRHEQSGSFSSCRYASQAQRRHGQAGRGLTSSVKALALDRSPADAACTFQTRCPFAIDHCREEEPAPEIIEIEHNVACHRWQDLGGRHRDRSLARPALRMTPALPQDRNQGIPGGEGRHGARPVTITGMPVPIHEAWPCPVSCRPDPL